MNSRLQRVLRFLGTVCFALRSMIAGVTVLLALCAPPAAGSLSGQEQVADGPSAGATRAEMPLGDGATLILELLPGWQVVDERSTPILAMSLEPWGHAGAIPLGDACWRSHVVVFGPHVGRRTISGWCAKVATRRSWRCTPATGGGAARRSSRTSDT